ncbi:MAG TPA: hypothetical protein VIH10_15390, partial [Kribbella sp.]
DRRWHRPNLIDRLDRVTPLSETAIAGQLVSTIEELERRRLQLLRDTSRPAAIADVSLRVIVMSWLGGHGFLAEVTANQTEWKGIRHGAVVGQAD